MDKELIYREVGFGNRSFSDIVLEYEKKGWRLSKENNKCNDISVVFERERPLDFVRVYYLIIDGHKRLGPFDSELNAKNEIKIPGSYYIEKVYLNPKKNTSRIDRIMSLVLDDNDEEEISCGYTEFVFGIDYNGNEWNPSFTLQPQSIRRTLSNPFYSSHEELRSQRVYPPVATHQTTLENIYRNMSDLRTGPVVMRHSTNQIISELSTSLNDSLFSNAGLSQELSRELDNAAEVTWNEIMSWPREPYREP